jgi:hypothetical protein
MEDELAFTTEDGARQVVYGAVAKPEEEEKFRGAYVSLSRIQEPSDYVLSTEGQAAQIALWVSNSFLEWYNSQRFLG